MNYYIYIYLDPRKPGQYKYGDYCFLYEPFYVGKGKGNRWKERKNNYCENKINKIKEYELEPITIKLKKNLFENESFILESKLINMIGRKDLNKGPLINFTNGGEGMSGYICPEEVKKKLKKNFQDIKAEFKKRGYILLIEEEEYKNNNQKLKYICPKGHKHSISWNNFRKEHNCPYCLKVKIDFSDIKEEFKKRGYILLIEEEEYKNNYQKLEYIHLKCANKHSIRWNSFKQGQNCPTCEKEKCSKKFRKNLQDIKNEFEKRGYILLTKEDNYKNARQKLEYIHKKCGKNHSISWNNFQQGRGCPCCSKNKLNKLGDNKCLA